MFVSYTNYELNNIYFYIKISGVCSKPKNMPNSNINQEKDSKYTKYAYIFTINVNKELKSDKSIGRFVVIN